MAGIEGMLAEIVAEFPKFRLVRKSDSRLMLAIDRFLRILTFGRGTRFFAEYHTVLRYTLYVAPSWETLDTVERTVLLRHERVHLRQCRRFGFLGLAFLYLVPFLPVGLSYGRARLEWEAYSETLRALVELRGDQVLDDQEFRARIVQRFVGPDYAWMWPFRRCIESWYDKLVLELREHASDKGHGWENLDTTACEGNVNVHYSKE